MFSKKIHKISDGMKEKSIDRKGRNSNLFKTNSPSTQKHIQKTHQLQIEMQTNKFNSYSRREQKNQEHAEEMCGLSP